jgi:hypothetical protein
LPSESKAVTLVVKFEVPVGSVRRNAGGDTASDCRLASMVMFAVGRGGVVAEPTLRSPTAVVRITPVLSAG